eukprot:jgi/Orpsp1_1/1186564/evm.model.d7180000051510.1
MERMENENENETIERREKEIRIKIEKEMKYNKISPLMLACYLNDKKMVKYLIKQNFNVNIIDENGDTPLTVACYFNNYEIINLLIENGAKVNVKNCDGESPISILQKFKNNEDIISKLKIKKNNESLIDIDEINKISNNSVFKIEYDIDKDKTSIGTGFFVKLLMPSENEPIYGLMTCNHILGSEYLDEDFKFLIKFNNEEKNYEIKLNKSYLIFTSKLLDVTFIQLNKDLISKLNLNEEDFLIPCISNDITDEYYVIQYPQGGNCKFANGKIINDKSSNNIYYFHKITTDEGSSGSPLVNRYFEVMGIHKGKNDLNVDENENIATKISIIYYALRILYKNKFKIKNRIIEDLPKELSKEELDELENHRIHRVQKIKKSGNIDKVFVTSEPCSSSVLYFYRTKHAWYWTNKINEASENEKFKIKNLKK